VNNTAPSLADAVDGRHQPRTHLFVVATLSADSNSSTVRIRNISPSGALLESSQLPEPGTKMMLKRGSLRATGRIAWKASRKAGIRFDSPIFVTDWLAQKGSAQQGQVDELVSSLKSGSAPARTRDNQSPETVELELMMLRADLLALGNALIGDPILVATHPEIQALDIGLQRIDRILLRLHKTRSGPTAG
jgi:PilZ domain-containing protein